MNEEISTGTQGEMRSMPNASDCWTSTMGEIRSSPDPLYTCSAYPREESVERAIALLIPVLSLGERSAETEQLRELLLDLPGIDAVTQLRAHLADLDQSGRRTPELNNVELRGGDAMICRDPLDLDDLSRR